MRTEFTYGQLDRVLLALGFSKRIIEREPAAVRYVHQPSGALVSVPPYPSDDRVLDYHLAAARFAVDHFGIADGKLFEAELQKAG